MTLIDRGAEEDRDEYWAELRAFVRGEVEAMLAERVKPEALITEEVDDHDADR